MHYVEFCDCMSDLLQVKFGVPLVSVLYPSLLILYNSDIRSVSKVLDCTISADYIDFFCSAYDISDMCKIITVELISLNN